MADNTQVTVGAGDKISTDELTTLNGAAITTGEKVQRVKVGFGSDAALQDVDAANPMPVTVGNFPATQPVSGPVTDTQLRATAVPVSGAFFQATQPVSGTFFQAAQPVTDNAGSLTVDAPVGTPVFVRLSDGAAAIATLPVSLAILPTLAAGVNNIGDVDVLTLPAITIAAAQTLAAVTAITNALPAGANSIGTVVLGAGAAEVGKLAAGTAVIGMLAEARAATLAVVIAGAANAIATLSLPAAGAGLFHYITYLHISRVATAALAGGAILTVTSTNLPGSLTWRTGNTMAIAAPATGTVVLTDMAFARPLKSAAANTATTVVGPAAGAAVSWHIECHYFTGA